MAYNVLYDGADDAKSVKAIEAEAPDLVCLTELTAHFVKTFEASLAKDYPYRNFDAKVGTWGVGFASKVPLKKRARRPGRALEDSRDGGHRLVRRHAPHAALRAPQSSPVGKHKKSDSFVQTLGKNADVRKKQAATLVARYADTKTPVVLLGDFNEEPGGEALAALEKAGWSRGCSLWSSSCSATWPGPTSPWPAVFMVDHVFSRGLDFVVAKTLRTGGSDHFPVMAKLQKPAR